MELSVFTAERVACPMTVVGSVKLLLLKLGSVTSLETVTTFVIVPRTEGPTVAVIVTVASEPLLIVPRLQVTTCAGLSRHDP